MHFTCTCNFFFSQWSTLKPLKCLLWPSDFPLKCPVPKEITSPSSQYRTAQIKCARREKTCLRAFWQRKTHPHSSQLQWLDRRWNLTCSKFYKYDTFQRANKKGADQTARVRRLVCAYVVRTSWIQVSLRRGPCHKSWSALLTPCLTIGTEVPSLLFS